MRFDHPFCERCSYLSTKADADTRAQYLKKKKSILENPEFDNQAFQESLQEAIEKKSFESPKKGFQIGNILYVISRLNF